MRDIHGLCDRCFHASDFPRTNCPYVCFVCSVRTIRFIVNRCFCMGYNVCKGPTDTVCIWPQLQISGTISRDHRLCLRWRFWTKMAFHSGARKVPPCQGTVPASCPKRCCPCHLPSDNHYSQWFLYKTNKPLTTYRQLPSVVRDKARDNNLATRYKPWQDFPLPYAT